MTILKKRIEIANALKVTSGSLNRPLNRLLDFDLIEYVNDKYQITDPIFSNWLRNSYEKMEYIHSEAFN